jgi:ABC-type uncharacterized transport system involved in gliding motility auxiliary subunit
MSRHHMLPPLAYVPPPRPKKIEKRRRRIDVGEVDDLEQAAEADTTPAGRSLAAADRIPMPAFPAIEASDRKPQNPSGRLSESTLTVMLQAQELK